MRLDEISICPVAVSGSAFATAVTPTHVKCLADGSHVPIEHYREYKSLMDRAGNLLTLVGRMEEQEQRKRDLDELHTSVSRMRLGILSR